MTDQATLAAELEAVASAVPGVRQLYPAGSAVGALLQESARAVGLGAGARSVQVSLTDGNCQVMVSIAVAAGAASKEVVRAVTDALVEACQERGLPPAEATVTVSHVTA